MGGEIDDQYIAVTAHFLPDLMDRALEVPGRRPWGGRGGRGVVEKLHHAPLGIHSLAQDVAHQRALAQKNVLGIGRVHQAIDLYGGRAFSRDLLQRLRQQGLL